MSKNRQETIADIINEKRTTAREIRSGTSNQYGRELAVMLEAEADRIEAAHKREVEELEQKVAELRECLKEAIREKCPFTRMSCKHGEPCDYECGTDKWRKALRMKEARNEDEDKKE